MNKTELEEKIINANRCYREGSPIMSDLQFDDLVDQYQKLVSEDEFNAFRNSLHEGKGKIKHPFIMGSLDKMKIEEEAKILKFLTKRITGDLNVSAKVDGISCRLEYHDGVLVSASTRGDGEFGEDISDRIKHVKGIPQQLTGELAEGEAHVRGELVILTSDFATMDGFANARNACAGIMNRDDFDANEITHISFIAYTILGDKYKKSEQFSLLENSGFTTTWHTTVPNAEFDLKTLIPKFIEWTEQELDFETDGLVVCSEDYTNEAKYRPDRCRAIKNNQLVEETRVLDISWDGPSKDGYFIPVAELEPVEIGGSTISRATLYNLDFIESKDIKYGSLVKLIKAGDIIPKITRVESNDNAVDIEFPTVCSCCGEPLEREGVNLHCKNPKCRTQTTLHVMHFIRKLDVKNAAFATLQNLNIFTYDDLIAFKANPKHKIETSLENELKTKVFTRSKQDLLAAINFKGIDAITVNAVIDFYGFEKVEAGGPYEGLPKGVGEITLEKFKAGIEANLITLNKFLADPRYSYVEDIGKVKTEKKTNGQSVCFTGALTYSRNSATKMAEDAGFEVKNGVTKDLTYLVTNDPNSGSGKNKKAQKLGIKIIDEKTFLEMLKTASVEGDLDAL